MGTVVAAVRPPAILAAELLATAFGRAGNTTVLDRAHGTVIHHASRRFVNQRLERLLTRDAWNVDASVFTADHGKFTYRLNDSTRVASFLSLSSPPWTVVVSATIEEFAPPFVRMRNVNLAVMLLAAVAIGVSFLLMTRRATESLEQLTTAADDVARGAFSPRLPPDGSDEVGRLSRAFRIMVNEVRRMLQRVEETQQMAVMGAFASRISHEIRNPLTSIKLNLQGLGRDVEEGRIPQQSARPVHICLREVSRLDQAVSRVLSMARTHPPCRQPCSLHQVICDAIEAVAAELDSRGVVVERRFGAASDRVMGDPQELEGVFVNLLVNAADAMPEGGTVRIRSKNAGAAACGGATVRVQVSDEGPGVPAEMREQIFRPFVSTKQDGTGFGLAVARRSVEEHQGRIDLATHGEGEGGATFVVQLPVATRGAPAAEAT
jgi:signal transduction histidine kinase